MKGEKLGGNLQKLMSDMRVRCKRKNRRWKSGMRGEEAKIDGEQCNKKVKENMERNMKLQKSTNRRARDTKQVHRGKHEK